MNWYIGVLKKYIDFNGRARRREYWFFHLFNMLFYIACAFIDFSLGSGTTEIASTSMPLDGGSMDSMSIASESSGFGLFTVVYMLATFLPSLGVLFRRLHDTGRSGWWWLIGLIPIIGAIVLLIFLLEDSQANSNQYGPNPKNAE